MKKLLMLLLALTLVFAFTACGDDVCESHVDENNDGKCDACDTEINPECETHTDANGDGKCDDCGTTITSDPNTPSDPNAPSDGDGDGDGNGSDKPAEDQGKLLVDALVAQLEAAASMKIDVEFALVVDQKEWISVNDSAELSENYVDGIANITITVSRTETGVNAKMELVSKTKESADGEYGDQIEMTPLYFIDGIIYSKYSDSDMYEIIVPRGLDEETVAQITSILAALTEGIEFKQPTEEEIEALKSALGNFVLSFFNVENSNGALNMDAKPSIDALLNYITSLNLNEKTVAGLINDILASVTDGITIEALVDELEAAAALTVDEAIKAVDAALLENYETTIQGIYDTIVNDADFVQIIKNYLALQGADEATVTETITGMQSLVIADVIESAGIKDLTLFEVIMMATAPEEEPIQLSDVEVEGDGAANEIDAAIAETFGFIREFLNMTLADFETNVIGEPVLSQAIATIKNFTLNELNCSTNIVFANGYNVSSVDSVLNVDFLFVAPSEFGEDKNNSFDFDMQLKVSINSLSTTPVEITLPENIVTFYDIDGYYYNSDIGNTIYISIEPWQNEGSIEFYFTDSESDASVYVFATSDVTLNGFDYESGRITIPAKDVTITVDGVEAEIGDEGNLVIVIDREYAECIIESIPEYVLVSE